MTAQHVGAKSWSIYPVPNSHLGHPKVMVDFHNWPEMGMCNFQTPIAHKRYWWDVRPLPEWINPNDGMATVDDTKGKGNFDNDA